MAVARQQQESLGDQGVQNVTALSLTSCQSLRVLLSFPPRRELPKTLTGIRGFDEITRGGLPAGRPNWGLDLVTVPISRK